MPHNISASVTWLKGRGAFEDFLTVVPEKTYFKSIYSRHTKFSWADVEVLPTQPAVYGGEARFRVPRIGDLVTQMYLYFNISRLNYGTANVTAAIRKVASDMTTLATGSVDTPLTAAFFADDYPLSADADYQGILHEQFNSAWIADLGYVLTQTVELWIGDSLIEQHTGDFLHAWDTLSKYREKSLIAGLPSEHGGASNEGTFTDQHIYVPLRFFFNTSLGHAFPVAALRYHEMEIRVRLSQKPLRSDYLKYFEMVPFATAPSTDPVRYMYKDVRVFTGGTPNADGTIAAFVDTGVTMASQKMGGDILKCALLTRYVFLDDFERQEFSRNKHHYLITETQHIELPLRTTDRLTKEYLLNDIAGSCKELIFFFRADEHRLEGTPEKNCNWEYWNFEGNRPYADRGMVNKGSYYVRPNKGLVYARIDNAFFDRATLSVNGQDLWDPPRDNVWYNYFLPAEFHTRIPTENDFEMVYVMPFSLFPESEDPSGSFDFSQVSRLSLKFWFRNVPKYKEGAVMSDGRVHVYARVMNVLEIADGHARKLFLH